jgi:hypothetical protein
MEAEGYDKQADDKKFHGTDRFHHAPHVPLPTTIEGSMGHGCERREAPTAESAR